MAELKVLNAKLLHHLPYDAVADRLEATGVSGGAEFWQAVHGNLEVFADVGKWWGVVTEPVTPVMFNDAAALMQAVEAGLGKALLPRLVADRMPGLRRFGSDRPAPTREIWLLVHPELRRLPRVAAQLVGGRAVTGTFAGALGVVPARRPEPH